MTALEKIQEFVKEHKKANLHDRSTGVVEAFNITLTAEGETFAYFSYRNPHEGYLETSVALDRLKRMPKSLVHTWEALVALNSEILTSSPQVRVSELPTT